MGLWAKIGYHFHADVLVGLSNEKKKYLKTVFLSDFQENWRIT